MTKASKPAKPKTKTRKSSTEPAPSVEERVQATLTWMKRHGSKRNIEGMARYAIRAEKVFGISVGALRDLGKRLGRDHEFAAALWETGWYEARMLTPFVDEPVRVTPAQMDRWCRDFDNWAICDALCFHLFDKTPHAWRKVVQWSRRRKEFEKRAAFALLASLALHDKQAPNEPFLRSLPLIEEASTDERNFVKKAVNWALRGIGKRNPELNAAAISLAERLAASPLATPRCVGKDALRELTRRFPQRRAAAG
jgi:3-methyladenine DNA glycosylase AlkD